MDKKKLIVHIIKIAAAAAVLALMVVGWAFSAFMLSEGGLLNSRLTAGGVVGMVFISIAMLAVYTLFMVWMSRLGNNAEKGKKFSPKEIIAKPLFTIVLPAIAVLVLFIMKDSILLGVEKSQAKKYVRQADASVTYDTAAIGDIMGTGVETSSVFADLSRMRVTFIYHMDYGQMYSVKLKHEKKSQAKGLDLQYRFDFSEKRAELSIYSDPKHKDGADIKYSDFIELKLADGDLWYAETDHRNLGLGSAVSGKVAEAEEWADEILAYGEAELPAYCGGYDRPTVFVNMSEPSVRLLFENKGMGCFRELPMHRVEDTSELQTEGIQQMFMLYDGSKLCACRDTSFDDERTNQLVFINKSGEYYATDPSDWGYYGFLVTDGEPVLNY
ncbi:hypothetical protein SAMN02910447_01307 [Ruminococcus sp. YE71]|uniref:hypothetical protein n=1 Tax=unclassified Ruminococcus TaxID=2608920 RepID=UPI00088C631C|nr:MULTISPECIES: hypothetical protein [unclassified Ruminococcus]SDA17375.1 hypothetical protein SAMN02910446_01306 [Ruminococcus sp. YE78]SFW26724.1 hypothetical protein SAMN02910447_01307 [Ruminococcus sp. YE71]